MAINCAIPVLCGHLPYFILSSSNKMVFMTLPHIAFPKVSWLGFHSGVCADLLCFHHTISDIDYGLVWCLLLKYYIICTTSSMNPVLCWCIKIWYHRPIAPDHFTQNICIKSSIQSICIHIIWGYMQNISMPMMNSAFRWFEMSDHSWITTETG